MGVEFIELIAFLEVLLDGSAVLKVIGDEGMFGIEALALAFIEVELDIFGVDGVMTGFGIVFVEGFLRLLLRILVLWEDEGKSGREFPMIGFIPVKNHLEGGKIKQVLPKGLILLNSPVNQAIANVNSTKNKMIFIIDVPNPLIISLNIN